MENCKETFLDDVVAVWPLAVGLLQHTVPETVTSDTVSVSDIGFASLALLREMLGNQPCYAEDMTGREGVALDEAPSVKVNTALSVSGYAYAVSLGLTTKYYHEEEKSLIRAMEWSGHDYIVERMSGDLYLVRYFAPAQRVTHQTEGAGAIISSLTRNTSGMQRIIE